MKESLFVSIITPVFNAALHLEETIQSVLKQTYTNWELLLVEDGSADSSLEIIKKYETEDYRIRSFQRTRLPKGSGACRNIGISQAKGCFIMFLDADDLLAKNCLENRLNIVKINDSYDFAVFKMEFFEKTPGDSGLVSNQYTDDHQTYLQLFFNGFTPWQTPCPLWKKHFLNKIGGWDESLQRITDPDLHSRALLEPGVSFKVIRDADPDCFYRKPHNPEARNHEWLKNSIEGRMDYFKKMHAIIQNRYVIPQENRDFSGYLSIGIKRFNKEWLLSRSAAYCNEYNDFLEWITAVKILNYKERVMIRLVGFLWKNDNSVIQKTRIKGVLTKLI